MQIRKTTRTPESNDVNMINQITSGERAQSAWLTLNRVTILYALSTASLFAQAQMPQPQGARVQQLPLSTREQGSISAQQSAGAGAGGCTFFQRE